MATTSLKITAEDGTEKRLVFLTTQSLDNIINVNIYKADEEFNPIGMASHGIAEFTSEEEYHKDLRKQSHEKGHFVPDYSTNPEWNPGYVEPEDDDYAFQGDLYQ